MSSTFTPSDIMDPAKERDWGANLGMLDWDSTRIVFTKRQLIEFLKYTGTTVDTNFSNISKLPRYAQFGKLSTAAAAPAPTPAAATTSPTLSSAGSGVFKSSTNEIFFEADDDALATAPPPPTAPVEEPAQTRAPEASSPDSSGGEKPSRRVRTTPGGPSSLGSLWDAEPEEFKPTRRVRQGPGGKDSISEFF
ncbi:hypothetical protein PLICRDRAFT_699095 [Plicaturopsis crispa FD-325 SS-3]|nr:hypothetical protein PLICRDRAFT_699095 [Plicaturopsis crispa FD-325 SS-3]